VLAGAALLALAAVALLGAAARAETGAPALELDGVWRARGDWTVDDGEVVVHAGERIEVFGNLTVEANASLQIVNSTVFFGGGPPGPRWLALREAAVLELSNATLDAAAPFTFTSVGGTLLASESLLRLGGGSASGASIEASGGHTVLSAVQVRSGDPLALRAVGGALEAKDADFADLAGASADIVLDGGVHALDTTRFRTVIASTRPSVTVYATVRFFLEGPGGAPVAGRVNGTAAYGERFDIETAPDAPRAVRFTWFQDGAFEGNITEGSTRAPAPVAFTAANGTVGGNTTAAWIAHHRENITVVLDGPYDLAVAVLRIDGRTAQGPPLKRAYYIEIGEPFTVVVQVENQGAQRSPPATLVFMRTALDPGTWLPIGPGPATEPLDIPSLSPGQTWTGSLDLAADTFGGGDDSSTPCTHTRSFTSGVNARTVDPGGGDFAPWNDERALTVVAYDVTAVPGPECVAPNDPVLIAIGAGICVAIVAAVWVSYHYSDAQVARRAASRARRPPPPP
jgi:hypothetical protein